MDNYTTNSTLPEPPDNTSYKYGIPFMIAFCLLSIFVNIRVLLTVHWIRRPLSPTLHISLSLAAADAFTSFLLCVGLFVNSYLPVVYEVQSPCPLRVGLEIVRLSGIIITVVHLLALSVNHWLGIVKPLHYNTMVTSRRLAIITVLLWACPTGFFATYFFASDDFDAPLEDTDDCPVPEFMNELNFRIVFSLLFFVPLFLMVFCYTHILFIVRRQQKVWAQLSRSGSTRNRGLSKSNAQHRRTMEGNVKAVHTTLLILGSCVIGWLPANVLYLMICARGCMYSEDAMEMDVAVKFFLAWLTNTLIILKTLANPIIYSSRMIEIQDGMRRMNLALGRTFCNADRTQRYDPNVDVHPPHLGYSGSVNAGAGVTALCNLNGSLAKRTIRSNCQPQTLV